MLFHSKECNPFTGNSLCKQGLFKNESRPQFYISYLKLYSKQKYGAQLSQWKTITPDFPKVKHNDFRGKHYLLCKRFIFINQRHKTKLRLLKVNLNVDNSYQPGKEIPAKANEDELL